MAVTECFSAEKENAAIDLIAASVTEELANDLHLTPEEILPAFLRCIIIAGLTFLIGQGMNYAMYRQNKCR